MARPKKSGLSYFPFDADFFSDITIRRLRANHGTEGITVYIYALCEIYPKGFCLRADEDFIDCASMDLGIDAEKVMAVLEYCCGRGLFDSRLYHERGILTSVSVQRRFQEASRSFRRDVTVNPDLWLLPPEETLPFIKVGHQTASQLPEIGFYSKNPEKSCKNSTKESKENKTKTNESKAEESKGKESSAQSAQRPNSGAVNCEPSAPAPLPANNEGVSYDIGSDTNNVVPQPDCACEDFTQYGGYEEYGLPDYEEHSQYAGYEDITRQTVENSVESVSCGDSADSAESPAPAADIRELLCERFGEFNVAEYEQKFRKWTQKKGGNVRADMYRVIEKWLTEDGVTKPPEQFTGESPRTECQHRLTAGLFDRLYSFYSDG